MHLKRKEIGLEYLKFWLTLLLFFVGIAFPIAVFAVPSDISLTDDGKIPGQPFQDIYQQIDQLETILNNIRAHSCPDGSSVVGFNQDGSLICSDIIPACEPPNVLCDGECKNLQTDNFNCGSCGVVCPSLQECIYGTCVGDSQPGTGTCQDPIIIDNLPFVDNRFLNGTGDIIQLTDASCNIGTNDSANPDVVYSFTPPEHRGYTITVNSGFDADLYITTQCDASATCYIATNIQQNTPTSFFMEPGDTYFLILTSASSTPPDFFYTIVIE